MEKGITPEEQLVTLLRERKYTVTTAESCTGGLIAAEIINVPGASWVVNQAVVTYSNEAKHRLLGVPEEILRDRGAVSRETAKAMAEGAAAFAGAEMSLISTGIAGPDGGTPEKPVGLVYLACCLNGKTKVIRKNFAGSRAAIRRKSVRAALHLALSCLEQDGKTQI